MKEYQTLSENFPLTMGQCLSLPIVLFSLYMLLFSKKSNILKPIGPDESPSGPLPGTVDEDKPKKTKKKKTSGKKRKASAESDSDASETDGER